MQIVMKSCSLNLLEPSGHVQASTGMKFTFSPLHAELNPICHLLTLLGGANIVVVSRLRVKIYQYRIISNLILTTQCHLAISLNVFSFTTTATKVTVHNERVTR